METPARELSADRRFVPAVAALAVAALNLVLSVIVRLRDGEQATLGAFAEGLGSIVWLLALATLVAASFGVMRRDASAGRLDGVLGSGAVLAVISLLLITVAAAVRPGGAGF
jgi:hypothetical protein